MEPSTRQSQFGDPDYGLAAFRRDVFGGGLRWLASVLAVLSAVVVASAFTGLLPPDLHWPIRATGTTAKAIAVGALVVWTVVAVVNWRSHLRTGRRGPAAR